MADSLQEATICWQAGGRIESEATRAKARGSALEEPESGFEHPACGDDLSEIGGSVVKLSAIIAAAASAVVAKSSNAFAVPCNRLSQMARLPFVNCRIARSTYTVGDVIISIFYAPKIADLSRQAMHGKADLPLAGMQFGG